MATTDDARSRFHGKRTRPRPDGTAILAFLSSCAGGMATTGRPTSTCRIATCKPKPEDLVPELALQPNGKWDFPHDLAHS